MAESHSEKWLNAPNSSNTVRIRMIDTTGVMLLNSKGFIDPVVQGRDQMSMTDVAFLVENERSKKKALFDLGIRKDFWNLPPKIQQRLDVIAAGVRVDKDVPEILKSKGLELNQIDDIIWSHAHWDHTGDPSLFPITTTLNFGPGLLDLRPGYPEDPESRQPSSNFKNRRLNEISFDSNLSIGGFPAHDFYGDRSFYLLETRGHAQGHISGLARVGQDPKSGRSTFVFMGGDVCHFCGDLRPNIAWPLSENHDDILKEHPQFSEPNPDKPLSDKEKDQRRQTPWYQLSRDKGTVYDTPGPEVAQETVDNLTTEFDSAVNVFVALAHDMGLLKRVPVFNEQPDQDLNDWFERGWKQANLWSWIDDLDSGSKESRIVDGFYKDGVRYDTGKDLLDSIGK